jgi:long-chain acyl-CoA synthetase
MSMIDSSSITSLNATEYEYIIENSGARMIIISDKKLYKCVSPVFNNAGFPKQVYTFDEVDGARNWLEIIEKGKSCPEKTKETVGTIKSQIRPEDLQPDLYQTT